MSGRSIAALLIVVVGILAIATGIVYLTQPAHALPSFFPGHLARETGKHTARGITAVTVGAVLVVVGAVIAIMRPAPGPHFGRGHRW